MQDRAKQAFSGEIEIKNAINSGCFAPCYLIFGEEHYLIKNYIKQLEKAVDGFPELNISHFDGSVKVQEVYDAVSSFPMMSSRRLVTLCDYPVDKAGAGETEKLIKMLGDIPSATVFVMWYETVEINSKKPGDKFAKLIKAVRDVGGEVCYLGRKSEAEIIKILQKGAAKRRCRIDNYTAHYMIETCSIDLNTLVNELEKLCLYLGEDSIITKEAVDKVCSRSVEAVVYNVSKTVLKGDLTGALRLLDDLFYMNTDPVLIFTFLSSAYIDIYRVFAGRTKGMRPDAVGKEFGYGNMAFRLNDAEKSLRKFSEKQIIDSLNALRDCEKLIKGSRADSRTALEKVLVELVMIAEGKR